MISSIVTFFALLIPGGQRAEKRPSLPKLPTQILRGDTRACHGFLKLRDRHLLWKSSFFVCESRFRVADVQDGVWTLELIGPAEPRSSQCSLKAVSLQKTGPATREAVWQVVGYGTLAASRLRPLSAAIACELQ